MKIKWEQIYEGWRNKLFPPELLKDMIDDVSAQRLAICEECGYHSKHHKTLRPDAHCTECGCTLSAKTKCLSCDCPLSKWNHVLTDKQEREIKSDIYGTE